MKNIIRAPYFFVVLYFIMIIVFASIYSSLPIKSFFHSTSKFEYSTINNEANELLSDLISIISKNQKFANSDSIAIDTTTIRLYSLNVKDFPKNIKFDISYMLYVKKDTSAIQISHSSTIIVPINHSRIIEGNKITVPIEIKEYKFEMYGLKHSSKDFFVNELNKFPNFPHITFNYEQYKKIVDFGDAYNGFPKNIKGNWLRMLYLSLGISTSTVFGDIVPLNSISRSLVSLQGFLSILIITLFFNSLTSKIGKRKNEIKPEIKNIKVNDMVENETKIDEVKEKSIEADIDEIENENNR